MIRIGYAVGTPHPADVAIAQMRANVRPDLPADDVSHFLVGNGLGACGYDPSTTRLREKATMATKEGARLCPKCFDFVKAQRDYDVRVERAERD